MTERRPTATIRRHASWLGWPRCRSDDVIWLAGSTFPPEEQLLISVFQRLADAYPACDCFLVPRHPERFDEVADLLRHAGQSYVRRSQAPAAATASARVLLIDSVGELSAWWGLAQIGFVGGSLGKRGGQNMIEPAGYGVSICFGPQHRELSRRRPGDVAG